MRKHLVAVGVVAGLLCRAQIGDGLVDLGCGGCHVFEPANSSGQTGPPLDDLAGLAEKAGQPVEEFTRQSITQPGAYIEEGFPDGVMPAWSGTEQELNDLVAFLNQS